LADRRVVGLFAHQRLAVEIPSLGVAERELWQRRLDARIRDCGCSVGAVFALVFGATAFFQSLNGELFSLGLLVLLRAGLKALLAACSLGIVGKILGLAIAKIRLKRDGRRLIIASRQ
jgi:hypothetical protein